MSQPRTLNSRILLAAVLACGACSPQPVTQSPTTDEEKTFYALGLHIAQTFSQFDQTEEELPVVEMGFRDGTLGKEPVVSTEEYGGKLEAMLKNRRATAAAEERKRSAVFLSLRASDPGSIKGDEGWVRQTVEEGTGAVIRKQDIVSVVYEGTLRTGKRIDTSQGRGADGITTINLETAIPCWTYGLPGTRVGGKYKLFCPADLAHGDAGKPPLVPGGAALVYEFEVVKAITF